ncbi:MAG: hypothetical protein J5656_01560 [Clostridia bacterium]|nr:hypothetical protein [Clostridia bacterium]
MRDKVYCKPNIKGQDVFFIRSNGEDYYLFKQHHRECVENRFSLGLSIDEALERGLNDPVLRKTAEKLKVFIPKCERENNMIFMNKRFRRSR